MNRKLFCIGILALLACMKPRAGGDYREIAVLADEHTWSAVESTLVMALEQRVTLLEKEAVFWVHWYAPDQLEEARRRPAMILIAQADEPGRVGKAVAAIADDSLTICADEKPFLKLEDPWARGQLAFMLIGHDAQGLRTLIAGAGSRLFDEFLSSYKIHVRERLYYRGPNLKQAHRLTEDYEWSIETPRPWQMIEAEGENWVHFVKSQPDRHIAVYWESWTDSSFRAERCLRLRRELAWKHYDEDEIDDDRTYFSWTEFLGRKALEINGAWVNWKTTGGGPFRTICFLDEEQQRLYMIDLVTFAPDRPKYYPMTQLGIIAETFRVGEALGPFASGTW